MVAGLRLAAARLARVASSPMAIVAVAAPPAATALLGWSSVLPWDEVVAARSVRAWTLAASVLVFMAVVRSALERRLSAALAGAALLVLAAFGIASVAPRLDVSADVGVGEEGFAWRAVRGPPPAQLPTLSVLEVPERGPVRLRVDGRDVIADGGRAAVSGGVEVTAEPFAAPSFSLRRMNGAVEGEGLLKVVPGTAEYFQVALLPHRFYVTIPATGALAALPDRLHLRVQRGKLKLLERDVALGETVEFEGLSLRFDPGQRWARVRLRAAPPRWALVAGIALAVGAMAAAWRRRKGQA